MIYWKLQSRIRQKFAAKREVSKFYERVACLLTIALSNAILKNKL